MTRPCDLAVFIARLQPFHDGHLGVVLKALQEADRLLILIGSANVARSSRNPFTYIERATMVTEVMQREGVADRVTILPVNDYPYDLQTWIEEIQRKVASVSRPQPSSIKTPIALTGHVRDMSSFYLRKFPQWGFIDAPSANIEIHATTIRHAYLHQRYTWDWQEWAKSRPKIPPEIMRFLGAFRQTDTFANLQNEFESENVYRTIWGAGPFQAADGVIIQSGHLLVVERKGTQGTGKLALPGGHLESDETLDHCAVREVFEETSLFADIPDGEQRRQRLWAGYRARERFDDPFRSPRARVITEAFLFKLPDDYALPNVKGKDDAKHAFWLPLSQVKPDRMFDDHGFIVDRMLRYL